MTVHRDPAVPSTTSAADAPLIEKADWYISRGISVIPVKADGTKSPAKSGWRKYANELPDDATVQQWFGGTDISGIGVVCGPASGHLVVLDFDCTDEDFRL